MPGNAFNENVDYLYQVQTDLEAVEQLRQEMTEYRNQEKNLKRAISSEEKSIQDEISQTIRRRKAEIEKVYDDQIDANKAKNRNVRAKRDKVKSKRIDERVEVETADLTEENRQLQVEMRTLFKAQHVPPFCRTGWFYSLFMTRRLVEVLVLLVAIGIAYVAVPWLVYLLSVKVLYVHAQNVTLLCALTVSLVLFFISLLYIFIQNRVKLVYYDTLLEGRDIMNQIAANKRQMKAIRNRINKDTDDSQYGLDKYDDKLADLEQELDEISQEKQDAMTVFENETRQLLTDEVNDRRLGRLQQMKADLEQLEEQMTVLEEDIQNSSRTIANSYGTILGKEFCTPGRIADLISLMEDGSADTVSEAIAAYKGAGR